MEESLLQFLIFSLFFWEVVIYFYKKNKLWLLIAKFSKNDFCLKIKLCGFHENSMEQNK